ncbi:hypothetical protein MTR_8g070920 [Medicago truncatula]|uniref:Uncharacterized protein n=1 Tax=Medicago truncatula TaxID=3880 RepID=A0A072TS72_MEDTR|nr:hypothetical protein MTR_8g070920 [Medicago truncatula]
MKISKMEVGEFDSVFYDTIQYSGFHENLFVKKLESVEWSGIIAKRQDSRE